VNGSGGSHVSTRDVPAGIRVLVVDDHQMFAESLVRLLSDEDELNVVGVAHSIEAAIRAIESVRPDVVLLDYRLPDGDAPDCLRRISTLEHRPAVLVMTGLGDDATLLQAHQAGCAGVITKDRSAQELASAVVTLGRGQPLLADSRLGRLAGRRPRWAFEDAMLTAREREVLVLLAAGRTTAQMAAALNLRVNTVRNHVQRILKKTGTATRLEAVAVGIRDGIIPPPC